MARFCVPLLPNPRQTVAASILDKRDSHVLTATVRGGPESVNKLLTTAAAVFKYAARHELTDRTPAAVAERCRLNAAENVIDAEDRTQTGEAVNPDEVRSRDEAARLIAAAEPGFYQMFFLTAVLTGARVGELTALTWDDVDLDAGTHRHSSDRFMGKAARFTRFAR